MTRTEVLDPRERLENVLIDIPLGTVFFDADGVAWVFIGTTRNTIGLEYHFFPNVAKWGVRGMIYSSARVEGGFRKFPGLRRYIRPDIGPPQG